MAKVIINKCFGGFGLSHKATMRYAEIKGITLYPYVVGVYGSGKMHPYTGQLVPCVDYFTAPLEDGKWNSKTNFYDKKIDRDDIALIQVVEEMGDEANGMCAELEVVEVPDDVSWVISEYDGKERVEEAHRSWY